MGRDSSQKDKAFSHRAVSRANPSIIRLHQQRGASILEYILLILLISVMGFASISAVGTILRGKLNNVNDQLGECVGNHQCGNQPPTQEPPP